MVLNRESIIKTLKDFVEAWNQGDLIRACEIYADDASFIGKSGYMRGKDKVFDRYRMAYSNSVEMGILAFELLECRLSCDLSPTMATVILHWSIRKENGEEQSGLAMETYERRENQIFIVQDATI